MRAFMLRVCFCLAATAVAGCDGATSEGASLAWLKAKPPERKTSGAVPPAAVVAPTPARRTACDTLTADVMGALLGVAVRSEAQEERGTTTCLYSPAAGAGPRAVVRIDWSSGADGGNPRK